MRQAGGETKGRLRRELGLVDAVAVGMGAIIGAGIFVVTGVAAGIAGPAFLIGLLIAGAVATFNALSSAQLAATYPQSGGTYEYGYRVLHPAAGFAAGWTFLASKLAAGGTVALGFAGYLSALVPAIPERAAAVAAIVLLTAVNLFGIRKAGRLNTAVVSLTVAALTYFVIAGIPVFNAANLRPFAPARWGTVLQSAALLFFAYTGYARLATLGEEVRDPKRTIPRAIVLALAASALLYAAVATVAVGAVGAPALAETTSPLQQAARVFALPGVGLVIGTGAMTAMLGVLLSQILGISRMMFAMARRRDLPPALDQIDARHDVPTYSIIVTSIILILVALFGSIQVIVAAAAFTILLYYSITNLAALRMRPEDKLFPNWVPVLGLISCLLLAFTLQPPVILGGLALVVIGFGLRWLLRLALEGRESGAAS
jgi:basic amino acid/polyamine antiporter, APA family